MYRARYLFTVSFLMVFLFMIGHSAQASEQTNDHMLLKAPTLVNPEGPNGTAGKGGNGNDETPGEWYAGETPDNLITEAPVLLFVPGLNNTAQIFWEDNDMYETAFEAGYQTVFVQLYDAGGESADMWNNGALLAGKINDISDHFDGKQITLVAYSKGGVDSQTALTYYGAWEHVENVITLSSPHHGSQLADLAYSFWAGWLADLIGMQGEGTYAMETAYMENFRTEIESELLAYHNDYFTLGGTDWGSMFSSTWFGGTYLSTFGDNDGVVTGASSNLPGGQELAIGEWNHSTIRTGQTFDVFQSYLGGNHLENAQFRTDEANQTKQPDASGNQWIHGGDLAAGDIEKLAISVEENVNQLSLDMMTAAPAVIKITAPDGKETEFNGPSSKTGEGIFQGAFRSHLTLEQPISGEWEIEMVSNEQNGYLLVADYDADAKFKQKPHVTKNKGLTYQLTADTTKVQPDSLRATYHIIESANPENVKKLSIKGKGDLSHALLFDKKDTVYNLTVDVEGITKSGSPFKRTIVDSVYSEE